MHLYNVTCFADADNLNNKISCLEGCHANSNCKLKFLILLDVDLLYSLDGFESLNGSETSH